MVKLIDVTGKVVSGEWGNDDLVGNGIPVLRTTNFNNDGTINYDNIVTRSITKTKINDKYLLNGDILIEKSGGSDTKPVGRVVYFEGEEKKYLYNNFTGLLRIKDKKEWYPKYIFYSLYANYKRGGTKIYQNKTTGLHNLKTENYISTFCIKQIPLQEQVDICNKLNRIKNIIDKKQLQLVEYAKLTHSLFIEMFGDPILNPRKWDIRKLNEITALITNGNTPKGGDKNYVDDGILFIRSQNVWKKQLILDDVAYIDTATHKSMKKSSVHNKDILITKTGRVNTENSSLGRAALFCGLDDSANINGHVYLVRLNGTIMPEYVVEVLTSDAYRKYIRKVCVGGIDKRQINLEQVEDFPIIIPPIENQRIFVFYIKNINKHKLLIID